MTEKDAFEGWQPSGTLLPPMKTRDELVAEKCMSSDANGFKRVTLILEIEGQSPATIVLESSASKELLCHFNIRRGINQTDSGFTPTENMDLSVSAHVRQKT